MTLFTFYRKLESAYQRFGSAVIHQKRNVVAIIELEEGVYKKKAFTKEKINFFS
jgi:hypothetical protein